VSDGGGFSDRKLLNNMSSLRLHIHCTCDLSRLICVDLFFPFILSGLGTASPDSSQLAKLAEGQMCGEIESAQIR